jgi:AcrR family transcriptional regulator
MARTKTKPDADVLDAALDLMRELGPDGLTFATLSERSGLSPATLVQRFGTKADLKRAALLRAWDALDALTTELIAKCGISPKGAIAILVGLSGDYGEIDAYAEGLLMLREDFRDPQLRSRGVSWRETLVAGLDACFANVPNAPKNIGALLASQWQGCLLWWGFEAKERVDQYVEREMRGLLKALITTG